MSINPTEIRGFGVVSGSDREITVGSSNLRAQVICPTCQNIFAGSFKRPDHATLHGVVLDIFVERPIHGSETMLGRSDSGQVARRAQQRSVGRRRRAKMVG